jgi:hypothetical protein
MRLVLATLLLTAAPLAAQEPSNSPLVRDMLACRSEADPVKRLACYDGKVGAFAVAAEKGDVKVVDREDVKKTRRALFGFTLPKLPFFSGDDSAEDQADEVETSVTSVTALGYGKFAITMADGAVWRTTENMRRDPVAGAAVKIRKASLGSYMLSVAGRPGVRALRVG